jgi:hypothetical protein
MIGARLMPSRYPAPGPAGRPSPGRRALAGALALALALAWAGSAPALRADEGMWTFDHPPTARIRAALGFAPDAAWLEHQRLAALRFPGGSGAFVSADGLVLTNHHVAHPWLEKLGEAGRDVIRDGFVARDRSAELRVPGLALRTLEAMEDVTAALERAVPRGAAGARAEQARREALDRLVRAAEARTGLASEPVTLHQGGETWIYSFRIHDDVRLVLAPEYDLAAFGKEWDNFTFPRHDLDFCLFRVYAGGAPLRPAHHLRWSRAGLRSGDPTFVVGHPARTARQETLAQMEAARDVFNPLRARGLERTLKALRDYAARGPEPARRVTARLQGLENQLKILRYETEGLKDPAAMARVAGAERELRARVDRDPALRAGAGPAWERIRAAVQERCGFAREWAMLDGRGSRALEFALGLARWKAEAARPRSQRELGYRSVRDFEILDANLAFPGALDPGAEEAALAAGLQEALEELGPDHPVSAALLDGAAPAERARALVAGTRLLDPEARRALARARPAALQASQDPLVVLARRLEQLARPYRSRDEAAGAVIADQGARIARARFALYGREVYPDASFSLRLSYGRVAPVPGGGTLVQPFTTFGGLYDRADAWGPEAEGGSWALPPRWRERRAALDPSVPLDFITTNDVTGGNSGSPVVDLRGELVGLVFDSNLAAIAGRYCYDPATQRAVCLDARAILEALAKVYDAPGLVAELRGGD